jgi:hypothetical protein
MATELEALAAFLDAGLPNGIQVYGYPPEQVTPPAVVVTPGDPAQAPYTMAGPGSMIWGVEIKIVAKRAQPQYALRSLFEIRFLVTQLLLTYDKTARWLSFSDVVTTKVGDIDYLQGTLTVTLITDDTGGT